MKFMMIYWIILLIIIIINLISYFKNKKVVSETVKDLSVVFIIIAFSFLIIALVTKDPIFEVIGLPTEYEWVGGLFTSAFTAWLTYFRPLKNRVTKLEINTGKIGEKVDGIDKNVEWIKNSCSIKFKK